LFMVVFSVHNAPSPDLFPSDEEEYYLRGLAPSYTPAFDSCHPYPVFRFVIPLSLTFRSVNSCGIYDSPTRGERKRLEIKSLSISPVSSRIKYGTSVRGRPFRKGEELYIIHPHLNPLPLSLQDKSSVPSGQRIKDKLLKGEKTNTGI